MPRNTRVGIAVGSLALVSALVLSGCSSSPAESAPDTAAATVTIESNNGPVEVPVNPERVIVLDNSALETVLAWDIEPVAAAKQLLPRTGFEEWIENDDILDVGTHREPNLEAINEAEPDLIIGGQRFADFNDELAKIATVVDIAPSDEGDTTYIDGLRAQTEALGKIFDREDDAAAIIADLDAAAGEASEATDGETVFLAVSNGGKVDNGAGRLSRILDEVNLVDVFASEDLDAASVHSDSGLAPETVAQANPDWMIIMDRDAIAAEGEFTPAKQIVAAQEAWRGTTFVTEDNIIYLEPDFYVTEGIQAYTKVYAEISEAFAK